jgi:hypothetical protein
MGIGNASSSGRVRTNAIAVQAISLIELENGVLSVMAIYRKLRNRRIPGVGLKLLLPSSGFRLPLNQAG